MGLSHEEVEVVEARDVDGYEVLTARALALVDMRFHSPDPCFETWFCSPDQLAFSRERRAVTNDNVRSPHRLFRARQLSHKPMGLRARPCTFVMMAA